MTIGELVTFITYLDMLVWPLQAMGFLFNVIQRGSVSYERIDSLLVQESDINDGPQPLERIKNGDLDYAIDTFSYFWLRVALSEIIQPLGHDDPSKAQRYQC